MRRGGKHTAKKHHIGGYGPGQEPVGYPWTADPMTWSGVLAANGANTSGATMSNYLPLSPNGIAVGGVEIAVPEIGYTGGAHKRSRHHSRKNRKVATAATSGSRKTKSKRRELKRKHKHIKRKSGHGTKKFRGGFGPQELINFGRDIQYQIKGAYDSFMGNEAPVNPSPLEQPINKNFKIIEPTPINLPRSFSLAGQSVAPL